MVPSRSLHLPGDAERRGDDHADPTDVATDFFAALALQDWERAVRLVEPRSLDEFRESQLSLFTSWAGQRDVRLRAFTGTPTLRELAALSPKTFAARYLAAERFTPSAFRVFGYVLESDDIAHVVYRPIDEALQHERLDVAVLHLRRHDDRWQVLLSQELADGAFILFHLDEPNESDDSVIDVRL